MERTIEDSTAQLATQMHNDLQRLQGVVIDASVVGDKVTFGLAAGGPSVALELGGIKQGFGYMVRDYVVETLKYYYVKYLTRRECSKSDSSTGDSIKSMLESVLKSAGVAVDVTPQSG